jgi:hypothetical protein
VHCHLALLLSDLWTGQILRVNVNDPRLVLTYWRRPGGSRSALDSYAIESSIYGPLADLEWLSIRVSVRHPGAPACPTLPPELIARLLAGRIPLALSSGGSSLAPLPMETPLPSPERSVSAAAGPAGGSSQAARTTMPVRTSKAAKTPGAAGAKR